MKRKRKKLPSLKSLREKAWKLQSIWIRSHNATFQGQQSCYTCYRSYPWKELQAGHFVHNSYDFDVDLNIRPQCVYCNKHRHGQPLEYYLHLVKEVGQEKADYARTRKHWNDYRRKDLEEIIKKYRNG